MVQEETRKGPWTAQEDFKLVSYVGLFGDRRWDFIAKVSGLNRTGKSCRLRWVNYLHPGLKHGKMTPQEGLLVMELHSKWGNRWSRIARTLPGRTDNEIKNYWRAQMRKQKKHASSTTQSLSPTSSSCHSSLSSSSNNNNHHVVDYAGEEESFYDTGGSLIGSTNNLLGTEQQGYYYSMDDIWKDIAISEQNILLYDGHSSPPMMHSPSSWDHYSSDTLWVMDEEERKMLFASDQYFS